MNLSVGDIRRIAIGPATLLLNIKSFPHKRSILKLQLIFHRVKCLDFHNIAFFSPVLRSHIRFKYKCNKYLIFIQYHM
jgi:hypothetical protein